MPPHCDSLDGPVVAAAREALATGDVDRALPYVPAHDEPEVREAFALAQAVRAGSSEARHVADRWFFETVVRLHRAGEGAPFTGLKPAGLDVGPVIPASEQAIASGSASVLSDVLCAAVRDEVTHRLGEVAELEGHAADSVEDARAHVEAVLGLQVWAHGILRHVLSRTHGHHGPATSA